ncbi:hypothetical protein [Nostoc sp.]
MADQTDENALAKALTDIEQLLEDEAQKNLICNQKYDNFFNYLLLRHLKS